jgi:hypothetical protein
MDPAEVGWGGLYWIHPTQERDQWQALENTVLNLWVPIKYWEFGEWLIHC